MSLSKCTSRYLGQALGSRLAPVLAIYAALSVILWATGIELLAFIPAWRPFVLGQPLPTAIAVTAADPVAAGNYFSNLYALFLPALAAALAVKRPSELSRNISITSGKALFIGFALAATFVFVNTASPESMLGSRSFPVAKVATLSGLAMVVSVTPYAAALVWLAYGAISCLFIGFVQRDDPEAR